jgi:hypothetical protein
MRLLFVGLLAAVFAVSGCTTGVGSLIEAPTGPSPRVVRLTVMPVGGGTLLIGGAVAVTTSGVPSSGAPLGAFAEYSNGQGRYVDAIWRSSDDNIVAVVDSMLVGRKVGKATLSATFEGHTDTEDFNVEPGFFGRWSGAYVIEQCEGSTGSMQDVLCRTPGGARSGIAHVGATFPFAAEMPETTSEDITGRVSLGAISGVLAGKNRGGGQFDLLGDITAPGGSISMVEWNTLALRDAMDGVFAYRIRMDGVAGTGAVRARLVNVTRQP